MQKSGFGKDAELYRIGKVFIDTERIAQYYSPNKNSVLMERSGSHVLFGFSNVDLHVHGHGYADAHGFVCSFAAFPEHPGSNVSLLN